MVTQNCGDAGHVETWRHVESCDDMESREHVLCSRFRFPRAAKGNVGAKCRCRRVCTDVLLSTVQCGKPDVKISCALQKGAGHGRTSMGKKAAQTALDLGPQSREQKFTTEHHVSVSGRTGRFW